MIDERVKLKLSEIFEDEKLQFPLNVAMMSAWVAINFKSENVKVIDIGNKSSLCDYFLVASVENSVLASSIIDTLCTALKGFGIRSSSIEGSSESDWFLVDLGDVIVHIFLKDSRELYAIDTLWSDAETVKIPDEYYFDSKDFTFEESTSKVFATVPDEENYF